jgi:hypothetical protein
LHAADQILTDFVVCYRFLASPLGTLEGVQYLYTHLSAILSEATVRRRSSA